MKAVACDYLRAASVGEACARLPPIRTLACSPANAINHAVRRLQIRFEALPMRVARHRRCDRRRRGALAEPRAGGPVRRVWTAGDGAEPAAASRSSCARAGDGGKGR